MLNCCPVFVVLQEPITNRLLSPLNSIPHVQGIISAVTAGIISVSVVGITSVVIEGHFGGGDHFGGGTASSEERGIQQINSYAN